MSDVFGRAVLNGIIQVAGNIIIDCEKLHSAAVHFGNEPVEASRAIKMQCPMQNRYPAVDNDVLHGSRPGYINTPKYSYSGWIVKELFYMLFLFFSFSGGLIFDSFTARTISDLIASVCMPNMFHFVLSSMKKSVSEAYRSIVDIGRSGVRLYYNSINNMFIDCHLSFDDYADGIAGRPYGEKSGNPKRPNGKGCKTKITFANGDTDDLCFFFSSDEFLSYVLKKVRTYQTSVCGGDFRCGRQVRDSFFDYKLGNAEHICFCMTERS